jgi:hypothetical protein
VVDARISLCEPDASMPSTRRAPRLLAQLHRVRPVGHDLVDVSVPIRRNITANSGELGSLAARVRPSGRRRQVRLWH